MFNFLIVSKIFFTPSSSTINEKSGFQGSRSQFSLFLKCSCSFVKRLFPILVSIKYRFPFFWIVKSQTPASAPVLFISLIAAMFPDKYIPLGVDQMQYLKNGSLFANLKNCACSIASLLHSKTKLQNRFNTLQIIWLKQNYLSNVL